MSLQIQSSHQSNLKPPVIVSSWHVMWATLKKDLLVYARYRAFIIGALIEYLIFLVFFGFFSTIVSFRESLSTSHYSETQSLFIFFIGGILLVGYSNTAIWVPVSTVQRDLYNGTLEYIYSTPTSRYAYFIGSILADAVFRLVFYFPVLSFLVFYAQPSLWSISMILLTTLVFMVTVISIGILIALTAMLWKQVSNILGILNMIFQFISGAFLPVALFPKWLQILSYLFPFTFAYDLVRYYSYNGSWITLLPVYFEWLILILSSTTYFLVSRVLLRKVEQKVKKAGLHLI